MCCLGNCYYVQPYFPAKCFSDALKDSSKCKKDVWWSCIILAFCVVWDRLVKLSLLLQRLLLLDLREKGVRQGSLTQQPRCVFRMMKSVLTHLNWWNISSTGLLTENARCQL